MSCELPCSSKEITSLFVGYPESDLTSVSAQSVMISLRVESEARGGKACTERGVFARFRYNDLKEDAGVCGGCGLMAMGIQSFHPSVSYWFCGT